MNSNLREVMEMYRLLAWVAWGAIVLTPIMLMFVCGILSGIRDEIRALGSKDGKR